ncbi:isoleucine--tRNA ligase [Candidatus Nomurabacteria bacterium]|nr:isoleucine--tRNA ligase [Candidatus Nomurabacteria bacterium]MCB9826939.1 isoleucine--tRNA ligase [Candidatus Nomurabacteria bacterium]MCB9828031.1 isoleucine--tRNA ligase [Candidatus Nomurabacteria bacterium]
MKKKFKDLTTSPDFPDLEKQKLELWKSLKAVESLKELRKDSVEKVYYDGPITANGMPHYGHAITWTMKDVIPRYWSMKNYLVSRNIGWDCQGIPVEFEIEKEMGFEHKDDIEEFGVAKFNEMCRQSVLKHRDAMFAYESRLGRWFDESDMYYTMDASYIESMWWALKELYNKGFLYQGYKVVAYSTRAGTSLSTHEVQDGGYKELEDPSVTLKFKLIDEDAFVLAWTTTPWTLPSNLMLAVGKKVVYAKVQYEGETYYVAEARLEDVFKNNSYKVLEKLSSSDLEGREYEPLFDYYLSKRAEGCFRIVIADHASDEDGTGIVHLAPYGAEDFDVFMALGIQLFDYLDESARFTDEIPELKGKFYKDANPIILESLEKKGLLFDSSTILHRMPICWRTGTPLIYKPIRSWYLATTKLKERMLEENQKVNWKPEHTKNGASKIWLENVRDWALSRSRYWGTPLPVWINDKTGDIHVIGSFQELEELSGVKLEDPHKPYVDEVTWDDKSSGGTFRRVPDVVDVWFDSGAVPFAKLHYPFENQDRFKETFPAEYISESDDQVRLWFYTMHVLGVALFDKVPYKNVVVSGMLLDEKGKKLSKSKKNYQPLDTVLDKYGGDVLRYFLLNSPIVQGESPRFYEQVLIDARKEFFLPLWNCVKYFVTYANKAEFEPDLNVPKSDNVLDKWVLARLQETINVVVEKMDDYTVMEAARQLAPLVNDLSTWYVRRSRDRINSGDAESLHVLFFVLSSLSKLIAPFVPFMAEEIYQTLNLPDYTEFGSVHFDFFPSYKELEQSEIEILQRMANTREVVSLALSVRVSEAIKIRQPLAGLYVTSESLNLFSDLIEDEVNVKVVHVGSEIPSQISAMPFSESKEYKVYLDTTLTRELELEGAARDLIRKIQDMRKEENLDVSDRVKVFLMDEADNAEILKMFGDYIKDKVGAEEIEFSTEYRVQNLA